MSLWRPSRTRDVLTAANSLLTLSTDAADKDLTFRALLVRRSCLMELGGISGAGRDLSRLTALAAEIRHPRCQWQVALLHASQALTSGDLSRSIQLTDQTQNLGTRVHDSSTLHYHMLQRFEHDRTLGCLDNWEELGPRLLRSYPTMAAYRAGYAFVLHWLGKRREARAIVALLAVEGFASIPEDSFYVWILALLAEVCSTLGEHGWSDLLYDRLLPFRHRNIVGGWGVAFDGSICHYLGLLAASRQRWHDAITWYNVALSMNERMQAPYLAARTRARLGEALIARNVTGDVDRGRHIVSQAAATFSSLGMSGQLSRLRNFGKGHMIPNALKGESHQHPVANTPAGDSSGGDHQPAAPPRTTRRYVFRREGDIWAIEFNGHLMRLRTSRGLCLLALLLEHPHREFHVLELLDASLVTGPSGNNALPSPSSTQTTIGTIASGSAGALSDTQARAAYRRRVSDIRDELQEAEQFNDIGRQAALRSELEKITAELGRAFDIRQRPRAFTSTTERARVNIRNNIANALRTISRHDAGLWRHLSNAVRTGSYCSYRPECPTRWNV